ncbi:hypothetical protein D1007_15819 [Hordeum vulgare]|nr:hypothetical protein D1007_15819 [Hordeum vulgare]
MGMGFREKHRGGSTVLCCVVLNLALLLVMATAKDLPDIVNSCEPKCSQRFDPSSDYYVGCIFGCDFVFSNGMRLQAHGDTGGEGGEKTKRGLNAVHLLSNSRCDEQCSQAYDRSSSKYSQCMAICSMI